MTPIARNPTSTKPLSQALAASMSVTLLGLTVLVYLSLLSHTMGGFSLAALLGSGLGDDTFKVAILKSESTMRHYHTMNGRYDPIFSAWKDFLKKSNLSYAIVKTPDLEQGLDQKIDVLLLPGVVVLSEKERQAIDRFLQRGGGVVVSGPTGLYTAEGDWSGWSLVERLTAAQIASYKPGGTKDLLFTVFRGSSPLNVGLPMGYRMELFAYDELFTAKGRSIDAVWLDEPRSYRAGGVIRNTVGKGRVVWFGFEPSVVSGDAVQQRYLRMALNNAVHWAGQQPIVSPPLWPHRAGMAFSLSVDVEDGFDNIRTVFPLLKKFNLPITFFIVTDEAVKRPALYRELTLGEMAIHADAHVPFDQQPMTRQAERLSKAKTSIEAVSGKRVVGFRPVEERYEPETLDAMGELGLEYLVINPDNQMAPRATETSKGRSIYSLFRAAHDDYDLFHQAKLSNADVLRTLKNDVDLARFAGGYYILPIHTTPPWGFLASGKRVDLLSRFLQWTRHDEDRWFATVGDVVQWWKQRETIQARAVKQSANRIQLTLYNPSRETVGRYDLVVFLPDSTSPAVVQSERRLQFVLNGRPPFAQTVDVSRDIPPSDRADDRLVLEFRDLQPRTTETYFIDLNTPQGGDSGSSGDS